MSASSSSNTSTNTGPNRFRGDAASFSPCQPTNSMNQQFFQQQVQAQQQQLYAHYLYNNGPMMQNHFYQYMPQYVIPGTPSGAYSEAAYYPYPGYQMPPPQMGYPMMQPSPVTAINYPQSSKVPHKKSNKNSKYSHNSQSPHLTYNHHSQKKEENYQRSSQSQHDDSHDNPSIYSNASEGENTKKENSPEILSHDVNLDAIEEGDKCADKEEEKQVPRIKFPLYFNINALEFSELRQPSSKRRDILEEKNENLKVFSTNDPKNSLLINTRSIKVIDLNSNSTVISKGNSNLVKINDNDTTDNEEINDDNEQKLGDTKLKLQQQPASNWASVLQSSSAIKNHSKPKDTSSTSTISNNPQIPSVPIHTSQSTLELSDSDFNINNESAQPLGTLLLRVMFDENYSVTSSQSKAPMFRINPRGLSNTGNICYMNSILQVLIYCEPFNRLLKLIETKSLGSLGLKSVTPLLDSTIKFFNDFVAKSNKALSPEDFYMNLIALGKFQHLKWGQQEDAEEFLGYYLDGLNEEFLSTIKGLNTPQIDSMIQTYSSNYQDSTKTAKFTAEVKNTIKILKKSKEENNEESDNEWSEVGANNKKINIKRTVEIEPTPLTEIFGGQFKSVLTIPKSASQSHKSITLDPFQNLQLDISEAETIEEAMMNLNSIETISYKSSNKEISIKKQTFIDKLPTILMVHLKRFSYLKDRDIGIEKVLKKISYGHDLTIPKELLSSPMAANYSLIGVVYHHGASAGAGHYTCDVLRKASLKSEIAEGKDSMKDEWIRIDDTSVKGIDSESVLNSEEESTKTAYILLYQKC